METPVTTGCGTFPSWTAARRAGEWAGELWWWCRAGQSQGNMFWSLVIRTSMQIQVESNQMKNQKKQVGSWDDSETWKSDEFQMAVKRCRKTLNDSGRPIGQLWSCSWEGPKKLSPLTFGTPGPRDFWIEIPRQNVQMQSFGIPWSRTQGLREVQFSFRFFFGENVWELEIERSREM